MNHHYDLNKLTGMEGRFLLEQIDREYLLVRPYKNPYMVFINLNKNTSTPLYTRLLPEQDQEYIKNMTQGNADPEFIPHVLYFKKREGSKLYFDYQSYFKEEPQTLVYEME